MHLLAAVPGTVDDGSEAVDLGQTQGDILVLSAADTEITALAMANRSRMANDPNAPSLRLANYLRLAHNMSVDLYVDDVVRHTKLVVCRLLGGRGYWPYGVDEIVAACRAADIPVAFLPGDDQPDAELTNLTSLDGGDTHRLWQYLVHGGIDNAGNFLAFAETLIGRDRDWHEPAPLTRAGLYWPGAGNIALEGLRAHWADDAPVAGVLFYRALMQAANLAPIDSLIAALQTKGVNPLPIHAASLKDPLAAAMIAETFAAAPPDVILNATGFALSAPGAPLDRGPFTHTDAPVLQVVLAGSDEDSWRDTANGLSARDIAMNVALPEVDGRVLARAVSFKGAQVRDDFSETDIVTHVPVPDRINFTADLAANWARLRKTSIGRRRVAIVLANYPNRDGRIGNGVGLDTPAAVVCALEAMAAEGYGVHDAPADGDALVTRLQAGPTNAGTTGRVIEETLPLSEYELFFAAMPAAVRDAVIERWGPPEADPMFLPGHTDCGAFAVPAFRCGEIAIGLQPARGYNIDPAASYHDPALVPPHGYFAFYAWARANFAADAIIHFGKHGNLEWLPGKAVALSQNCFPEAALGPLPHIYPFIVNDPGEGTQAKRRAAAVIIDHLTPPLARAETYGPLKDLEALVDEYYEAANIDPRRLAVLGRQIVELVRETGLDRDLGFAADADLTDTDALNRLDGYLCELKELQIRDGLHVFGQAPTGPLRAGLLSALVRLPRGTDTPGDASLSRALVEDLGLGFDPLECDFAAPWDGPQPSVLNSDQPWRTVGDTVERLELLATALIDGTTRPEAAWTATAAVLERLAETIAPAIDISGDAELAGLLTGLDGRFVAPGPSGAPTRGRPDVLPTGRNFYSVDTRTVPTPAAWELGWKSAQLLVETHAQTHGDWPRTVALSAWGTSNMRTGGDDIAQAMAMIGAQPTWDSASRRVTGFEIMPVSVLDRPRVDVTLRVSGFFRDAFPGLIDLFDSAVTAIAAITDESPRDNPLAARTAEEIARLTAAGMPAEEATRRAGYRIFGSKPGAYGAGLQALIDERGWDTADDLAAAYIAWGGWAYGAGTGSGRGEAYGIAAHDVFAERLGRVEAVIHNQDNREHDLLDSDDYYQFEGGLAAAVTAESGAAPTVYHNDHSRPFAPAIRTLEAEISRVVRGRVTNPKWIEGVMRHGYKGAFEMAATVDYLFAFAATTNAVRDDQFDAVYKAFLDDERVRAFIAEHNPAALNEMAERFLEATERGLWQARSNSAYARLHELAGRQLKDSA
ncbi:MAG: cobaltochelatase subunit CobN [Rhodospirillaceae bacterium]|jgi:cobaltochelatase CobN|nr:cobaltochelatase subunit CobN [Rhodospirillaceae bacterium]MBT5360047.1 cobaltochelatase subunit CobN [Rhodospirillaceae bacterium]MBT6309270.1 cobaltochelatase subunit CobN [Rhodospirillaceae bacterium]MBT7366033.1 cobaltochelatase subunit CobN [Rhodospirillaceae bacterium]